MEEPQRALAHSCKGSSVWCNDAWLNTFGFNRSRPASQSMCDYALYRQVDEFVHYLSVRLSDEMAVITGNYFASSPRSIKLINWIFHLCWMNGEAITDCRKQDFMFPSHGSILLALVSWCNNSQWLLSLEHTGLQCIYSLSCLWLFFCLSDSFPRLHHV